MSANPKNVIEIDAPVDALDPGLYVAHSDNEGYGALQSFVVLGLGRVVAENLEDGGHKSILVRIGDSATGRGAHKNPEEPSAEFAGIVRVGDEFYSRALDEYSPPMLMWWREVIQNSVDAGERYFGGDGDPIRIRTTIEDKPDGTQVLTCEDNCGGMSLDVLQANFLTISGSGKRNDTSAMGGFGIAKELILFPWIGYEIHTQDSLIAGSKGDWKGKRVPRLDGTRVSVHVQGDAKVRSTVADPITVIERSYLDGPRFTVNGEYIHAALDVGDEIPFDGTDHNGQTLMSLYHKPRARKSKGLFVRKVGKIGSLYMFEKSIDSTVPGYLCLELTGPSKQTMTAQRNRLKDVFEYKLERFLRTLSKDQMTVLRKKKNALHKKWEGKRYRIESDGELASLLHQIAGRPENFTDETNLEKVCAIFEENEKNRAAEETESPTSEVEGPTSGVEHVVPDDEPGGPRELITSMPGEFVSLIKELIAGAGASTIDTTIRQISHSAAFYIHNEVEDYRVPKKLQPTDDAGRPTMSGAAQKLARFWAELCRAILIAYDGERFVTYGIGWIFDTEFRGGNYETTLGEYIRESGNDWLLLNPYKDGLIKGKLYSLRSDADLTQIFSIAMHECAHLVGDSCGHDESFAAALTTMIRRAAKVGRYLRKIRDVVVKRRYIRPGKTKTAAPAVPSGSEELEEELRDDERRLMEYWRKRGSGIWVFPGSRGFGRGGHTISLETDIEPKGHGIAGMRTSILIDGVPSGDSGWFTFDERHSDDWSTLSEMGAAQDVERALHKAIENKYSIQF